MVQVSNSSIISGLEPLNVSSIATKAHSKEKTFFNKPEGDKKLSIRLNKRFHPKSITTLEYTLETPVSIISEEFTLSKPKDYLLISSILTDSLRGPPVVS